MLHYRRARSQDLPQLLKAEQAVVEAERPFNQAIRSGSPRYYDLPSLINNDDTCLLVGEDDGGIVATGYGQVRQSKASLNHDWHCYLGFMYVAPQWRGKGVNREVMKRLIDWAKSRGVQDFYLDVYTDNKAAINAYGKLGFRSGLMEMKLHL